MNVHVETTDDPAQDDKAVVLSGLDSSNRAAVDLAAIRPLAAFVRDEHGTILGGVLARTWGECCEVMQLWVDEAHRRRGHGRSLMRAVETESRNRGCTRIHLDTFSFQAPDFYAALGYAVVGEFTGFPDGVRRFFLERELAT